MNIYNVFKSCSTKPRSVNTEQSVIQHSRPRRKSFIKLQVGQIGLNLRSRKTLCGGKAAAYLRVVYHSHVYAISFVLGGGLHLYNT